MSRQDELQRIIEAIGTLTREFNARGRYPFRGRSIGRSQLNAVFVVSQTDGLSVGKLAAALQVTSGAVSQVVDSLQQGGWVTVQVNPADRRGRIIRLTDDARREVNAFQQDYFAALAPRFDALNTAEVAELDRLLHTLSSRTGSSN